jgi:hypothetical protein
MLGKRQNESATGSTERHHKVPNHNFGKDEYVVDMTGHEV